MAQRETGKQEPNATGKSLQLEICTKDEREWNRGSEACERKADLETSSILRVRSSHQ